MYFGNKKFWEELVVSVPFIRNVPLMLLATVSYTDRTITYDTAAFRSILSFKVSHLILKVHLRTAGVEPFQCLHSACLGR
jgi:hypothetical protein